MGWELGISRCKLLYREWINEVLLYSTGNYIPWSYIPYHSMISHFGKEYDKECTYVCVCVYKTETFCCRVEINTIL